MVWIVFFRSWRSWLNQSKEYTLKECFISTNCYLCIELNAHSLVKQLLKLDDDEYSFCPDLQGSQPCETLFRQARSFSSMYSNVVNFTMLELINRINKIQLQADIIKKYSGQITFPRFEKKQNTEPAQPQSTLKLTKNEIITQIENARCDVMTDIESLGIESNTLDYHCQVQPTLFRNEFSYEEISDDEDISDDENIHDDENVSDDMSDADELEDRKTLSGVTGELLLKDYSRTGMNVNEEDIFAIVATSTGKAKKVRKSAIVWYLNNSTNKLSSDRLHRVRAKDYDNSCDKDSKFADFCRKLQLHK